jgi:hypothetical protein
LTFPVVEIKMLIKLINCQVQMGASRFEVKRELGASPKRSRHCNRRVALQISTVLHALWDKEDGKE